MTNKVHFLTTAIDSVREAMKYGSPAELVPVYRGLLEARAACWIRTLKTVTADAAAMGVTKGTLSMQPSKDMLSMDYYVTDATGDTCRVKLESIKEVKEWTPSTGR